MLAKIVLGLVLCGFAGGCTTVLYDGPQRPQGEVARIVAERGTTIVNVDARPVIGGSSSVYEVLPGPHQVAATPSDLETAQSSTRQTSPGGASACFEAKPAKVFTVSTVVQDWKPWTRVVDRESGENVEIACVARATSGASPARRPEPVEHPPSRESSDADNDSLPSHPWGGFRLGTGYSFGGDDLLNGDGGEPFPAGAGWHVSFGGTLMPLWIGNVGFGVGGSYGLKHNDAGDGTGLSRSPAELWLEMLVRISPRWFVDLSAGAHKDYGVSLEMASNRELQSRWGRVLDVGLYTVTSKHVAWGFGVHSVDLRYESYGRPIDASSTGLEVRLCINP
jgi:hypothetical protein